MSDKITKEMLEDGKLLIELKNKLLKNYTQENMIAVLVCLRDSTVFVPLTMQMSQRDEEKFKNGKEGDTVECEDEVHLSPDIFKTDEGSLYFPIFSNREEVPEEYAKDFSLLPFDMPQCLHMAHSIEGVNGIVLDALTQPLPLVFEIADVIEKLPSMIG